MYFEFYCYKITAQGGKRSEIFPVTIFNKPEFSYKFPLIKQIKELMFDIMKELVKTGIVGVFNEKSPYGNQYEYKYLKYKQKYLQLKQKLNN